MTVNYSPSFRPHGSPVYAPNARPTYRGGAAAGGSFDPSSRFTGAQVGDYWIASDLTRMWQDSGGTTPVASNGDVIGKWTGQRDTMSFVQGTTGLKPLYDSSLPSVYFSLSNKIMTTGEDMNLAADSPFTMFAQLSREDSANELSWALLTYSGSAYNSALKLFTSGRVVGIARNGATGEGFTPVDAVPWDTSFGAVFTFDGSSTAKLICYQETVTSGTIGAEAVLQKYLQIYNGNTPFKVQKLFFINEASTDDQLADLMSWGAS